MLQGELLVETLDVVLRAGGIENHRIVAPHGNGLGIVVRIGFGAVGAGRLVPETFTLPLPSSLPVMASASVSYWDFALSPSFHWPTSSVTSCPFLPVDDERVFLDGRGAGPRRAGVSLGTRLIQYGIRHGLEQLAGPVGQCHGIDRRFGGLRLVAVRTVRSGSLLARRPA